MSLPRVSRPMPTVNTGTWLARSPSNDSWIEDSSVSAPSVTMTRPASGKPVNSSFARSSASPSLVCVPSNDSSRADPTRSVLEAKRNTRTA